MNTDTARMRRLTLRFADAGLEIAFSEEQARKAVRPVRIVLACLCAGAVAFYVLTIHVFHHVLVSVSPSSMFRLVVVTLVLCVATYALTHRPVFVRRQQLIMFLLVCGMSVGVTRGSAQIPLEGLESRGFLMMLLHTLGI